MRKKRGGVRRRVQGQSDEGQDEHRQQNNETGQNKNKIHADKTKETKENCQKAPTKLSCLYANARSIINKFEELELYVKDEKPDIIGITEAWTREQIGDSEINLNGYTLFRRDRGGEKMGGGVLLYVNSDRVVSARDDIRNDNFEESVWCDINCGKDKTLLGICYRPPNSNDKVNDGLIEILEAVSSENVLVMGDFNFPGINWEIQSASGTHCSKFLECIQDCFLYQHVGVATRGDNILDLVLSSEQNMVENLEVKEPFGDSDHCVIKWDTVVEGCMMQENKLYFDYFKADYQQIRAAAQNIDFKSNEKGENVEQDWQDFRAKLENLRDTYVQQRKFKIRKEKWVNREVMRCRRAKNKAWKRHKKVKTERSYDVYKTKLRKSVKTNRKAKENFELKLALNVKTDSKSFFSYVRGKQRTKDKVGPLKDHSGKVITEDAEAAGNLNEYFVSVFTEEDKSNAPVLKSTLAEENHLTEIIITESMVSKKLKELKIDKSPGPDGMHPRLLKELSSEISEPLARMFQNSVNSGVVPSDWKKANISAVHKKGSRAECQNYRPISLTSVVCKVLESLIKDKITEHLDKFELIKPSQHGFTAGRSCLTNLLEFFDDVTRLLDSGKPVDVIYLDFAKAFDKVPHERLINKVKSLGINGTVLKWISGWLSERAQRVTINGIFSQWREVKSGVPQGSVLGPLLFLIFINDLDEGIMSKICKFADDTKCGRAVSNDEEVNMLKMDLKKLCDWADTWQMKFNVDKCVVMHFGSQNNRYEYEMNGRKLKASTTERDLGVVISDTGKPSEQCLTAANKANSVLGVIKRNIRSRNKAVIVRLYKTLVRPKLEYCVQAWNPFLKKDIEVLEKVQKRATRLVAGYQNYSYEQRLRFLDLQPLDVRRTRGDMIEVFKLIKGIDCIKPDKFFTIIGNSRLRGHQYKMAKSRSRLEIRKHYFSNRIVDAWNALPEYVVSAESVNVFKARLDKFISRAKSWGQCRT